MRQTVNILKLLTTFNSPMLSRNTKVVRPYRLFSTSHEKTITVEQHHFDLLKKDSETLSQQIQSLSSSINNLESKVTNTISNLDNKFTSTISNLDNKFTSALQVQSNYLEMKFTNGLDSLRKDMKEENKALESKIEAFGKNIKEENKALESKIEAFGKNIKEENSLLRQEIKEENKALESKIEAFRKDIKEENNLLRQEMKGENNLLRQEMKGENNLLRQEIKEELKGLKHNLWQFSGLIIAFGSLFFAYDQFKEKSKPETKASLGNETTAKPAERAAVKLPSIFSSSHSTAKDSSMLPRA